MPFLLFAKKKNTNYFFNQSHVGFEVKARELSVFLFFVLKINSNAKIKANSNKFSM
jgi:hypothetical protein